MKNRAQILDTLSKLFISTQDDINEIREGSVVRALLFSIASEIENVYDKLDEGIHNLYIDKAAGDYLDSLIEGFTGLVRKPPTRSTGYVLLELGESIDDSTINKLSFSFSRYVPESDTLETEFPGTITYTAAPEPNKKIDLTIIQPQSVKSSREDFIVDAQTGIQPLFSNFLEFLRIVYSSTGKPLRYIILPVATLQVGNNTILKTGQVDNFINIGIPARIVNLFIRRDSNLSTYSIADPDGVSSISTPTFPDSIFLGDASNIAGGSDKESDDLYRERYYLYMLSLSRGTQSSIELGIKQSFPSVEIKTISSSTTPGEVDVVVYSKKPVTPNIISSITTALNAYRPVGIKLNIYTAKPIRLAALMDVVSNNFKAAVEKSRSDLANIISNKPIGQSLAYTEIHEGLDIPEIQSLHNVFYGLELNQHLFDLYKTTLTNVYSKILPFLSTYSFSEVYQEILDNPHRVILFDYSSGHTGYPLVEFVRAAKAVPDPTVLQPPLDALVASIHACPTGTSDVDCLPTLGAILGNITVTLEDVITLVSREVGVYYKTKLLTLPNILHLPAPIAENLLSRVILNDVLNLTNRETSPVVVHEMEQIILGINPLISDGVYKNPELVGVRSYESIN